MQEPAFKLDLLDIVKSISKWKKYIIAFALLSAVVAAIFLFLKKNQYKAYGVFYPASAIMSGRINMFREINQDWLDFYGAELEVDRAYVIGNSAPVIANLITRFKLDEHYKIDTKNDPKGAQKVYKQFTKNFSLNRTGFKNIEVSFQDEDDQLASDVVNEAMAAVEDNVKSFYVRANTILADAILLRAKSIDSAINMLTDSLVNARTMYGIYDIISPVRTGNINFTPKGSGPQYARGVEEIQNIEAAKDKLVMDKTKYVSLSNEFKTGANKAIPSIHVVQYATPNGPKAGPFRTLGVLMTFIISLIVAAFFAVVVDTFFSKKEITTT